MLLLQTLMHDFWPHWRRHGQNGKNFAESYEKVVLLGLSIKRSTRIRSTSWLLQRGCGSPVAALQPWCLESKVAAARDAIEKKLWQREFEFDQIENFTGWPLFHFNIWTFGSHFQRFRLRNTSISSCIFLEYARFSSSPFLVVSHWKLPRCHTIT